MHHDDAARLFVCMSSESLYLSVKVRERMGFREIGGRVSHYMVIVYTVVILILSFLPDA